jgi:hypothetical protein
MDKFLMAGAAVVGALIATMGHRVIDFDFSTLSLLGS